MTAFNQSAIPSLFFGHNSTVKAWCVTGNFRILSGGQAQFDAANFVDGFNLRLSYDTQTSMIDTYRGALKFSFIDPLPTNKYKVFVQVYGNSSPRYPQLGHVLNSTLYPKTTDSFWIRVGYITGAASVGGTPPVSGHGRVDNQVHNIVLWNSATTSIGVVVI